MSKVILKDWRDGMEKVSLTKLQMDLLHISLKESKTNVDSLLGGKEIILEIKNEDVAKDFLEKTEKIGVSCDLELDFKELFFFIKRISVPFYIAFPCKLMVNYFENFHKRVYHFCRESAVRSTGKPNSISITIQISFWN